MNVPSSVTGPDRVGSTDTSRRTHGHGSDGEEFGNALSAELSRPTRDESTDDGDEARADAERAAARAADEQQK